MYWGDGPGQTLKGKKRTEVQTPRAHVKDQLGTVVHLQCRAARAVTGSPQSKLPTRPANPCAQVHRESGCGRASHHTCVHMCMQKINKENSVLAEGMAQQVKELAAEADSLSSSPRAPRKLEKKPQSCPLTPHSDTRHMQTQSDFIFIVIARDSSNLLKASVWRTIEQELGRDSVGKRRGPSLSSSP